MYVIIALLIVTFISYTKIIITVVASCAIIFNPHTDCNDSKYKIDVGELLFGGGGDLWSSKPP